MYFMYDKDTFEYKGALTDDPGQDVTNYTEVAPSEYETASVWYLRIYQPKTDTWRDWAPSEYEKSMKPSDEELFKMEVLAQMAELRIMAEVKEDVQPN